MNKKEKIDFEAVLIKEYDINNRGRLGLRTIQYIKENKVYDSKGVEKNGVLKKHNQKLCPENQKQLLEYADFLARQVKRNEISHVSFPMNLRYAWNFCKAIQKPVQSLSKDDIVDWWQGELYRYEEKQASHSTLKKTYHLVQKFLKVAKGLKKKNELPLFLNIEMPPKPKNGHGVDPSYIPTPEQVKMLIDCVGVK